MAEETTTVEETEGRKPWIVAEMIEGGTYVQASEGFRTQAEADEYIRASIDDKSCLCSLRKGKAFRAEVVRKTTEVDL